MIDKTKIQKAEQCLIDNGIKADEVSTVLQALGYILLDDELYPDKKYMLITVVNREVMTEQFDSFKKAHDTMLEELSIYGRIDKKFFTSEEVESPDNWGYCRWNAYVNNGVNHEDYDWSIIELN